MRILAPVSLAEHARLLVDYNEYANLRVLERALTLDDAALRADGGASKGSILGNLQHILGAQDVWLDRWIGERSTFRPPEPDELPAAFDRSHARFRAFASTLADADWDRVIEYTDSRGVAHAVPLGLLITHTVNHGTLHRGEAGMLFAARGASPGDLDFVLFVLDRQART